MLDTFPRLLGKTFGEPNPARLVLQIKKTSKANRAAVAVAGAAGEVKEAGDGAQASQLKTKPAIFSA